MLALASAPEAVGWKLVPYGDVGWSMIVKCSGHTHLLFVIFRLTSGLYSRMAACEILVPLNVFKPPVAKAAVHYKAVVLLLLIHCLLSHCSWGFCVSSFFVKQCLVSFNPLYEYKRADCFTFSVFLMSCDC